jgi:hypothetical protein
MVLYIELFYFIFGSLIAAAWKFIFACGLAEFCVCARVCVQRFVLVDSWGFSILG